MRGDFGISPVSKVPGADLDAKNSPRAGIKCVLLAEPARHEGRLDEEPEDRLRWCGNKNLAFNSGDPAHRRLDLPSFCSAARLNRDNPLSQNAASSTCRTGNGRLISAVETLGARAAQQDEITVKKNL